MSEPPAVAGGWSREFNRPLPQAVLTCPYLLVGYLGVRGIYNTLHEDYEGRASVEARLVKAADIIDLLAQALNFERAGARELGEFWEGAKTREFGLEGAAREVVGEVIGALVAAREELK